MTPKFVNSRVGWVFFLAVWVAGCYPASPDYIDELDLVFSSYDKNYAFAGKNTYAMPDSIVRITGNKVAGEPVDFMAAKFSQPILANIEKNMTARGYTRVDISASPKLLLAPASMEVTTYYYDWWYYWGYWWSGYYPGWGGWYYPPTYPVVSGFSSGTLILTLTDPNNLGPEGTSSLVWTMLGNGILTGSYSLDRVNKLVDQGFAQSPYLKP